LLKVISLPCERERAVQMLQFLIEMATVGGNPGHNVLAACSMRRRKPALPAEILKGCLRLVYPPQLLEKFSFEDVRILSIRAQTMLMQVVQRISKTALV